MPAVNEEDVYQAIRDYVGWCTSCQEFTRDETDPDAEHYKCPVCEQRTVMGAEQALMVGAVDFK